jgi:aquaporin Z
MARYLTEFIGTFFLVFTVGMVVTAESALAPLAIGAVLMVMVYLGGHISGAHYNPAVTVALLLRGKLPPGDGAPYLVAQLLAAFVASGAVFLVAGDTFAPAPGTGASVGQAFLAEALFTFALVLVILNVATAKATEGNDYYGLAIGFTVMAGAFAVGNVSGGAFNPAVGTGPIVFQAIVAGGSLENLWLYWAAPLTGAVFAAVVFALQHPGE